MTISIEGAVALAATAHMGQLDKAGEPYILHPLRVMLRVPAELRVVAVLHDVIEDCPGWGTVRLLHEGVSELDVKTVDALTRRPGETYQEFIGRCRRNEASRIVKLADLADNIDPKRVQLLPDDDVTRGRIFRYIRARAYLMGIIAYCG